MKTHSYGLKKLSRRLGGLLGAVALLVSAQKAAVAAPSADPSNGGSLTWDCIETGRSEQGIAMLTFDSGGGLTGYEINVSKNIGSATNSGRTVAGDGRDLGAGNGTNGTSSINGFGFIDGQWAFDPEGRIIGNYVRETAGGELQPVSFVGKATSLAGSNPRLNLVASSVSGQLHFKGVLPAPLLGPTAAAAPDVSGSWMGIQTEGNLSVLEFFTLSAVDLNLYVMTGASPSYSYGGICLVSGQGKIAFDVEQTPSGGSDTNVTHRYTYGSLRNSSTGLRANTVGLIFERQSKVRFKAAILAPPAP